MLVLATIETSPILFGSGMDVDQPEFRPCPTFVPTYFRSSASNADGGRQRVISACCRQRPIQPLALLLETVHEARPSCYPRDRIVGRRNDIHGRRTNRRAE